MPGCRITKGDIILDFEDTTQGGKAKRQNIRGVQIEGTMY